MHEAVLPNRKEVLHRIRSLQDSLAAEEADGALLVQKVDLYYFSGTDQDAQLWVPVSGEPVLLVRKSLERARRDGKIDRVEPMRSLRELPERLQRSSPRAPRRIGMELDVIPAVLHRQYAGVLEGVEILDASPWVRSLRMVKSAYEVSRMQAAARVADGMFERVPEWIRSSENETELALQAEAYYRRHGHPGVSRTRAFNMETVYGHIMAGPGGAEPSGTVGPTGGAGLGPWFSQGAGWTPLRPGQPIMVDYTACVDGYLSDQARVFSIGPLPKPMEHAHEVMVEVLDSLAEAGGAGVHVGELYAEARRIVEREGLEQGFMGFPRPVPFVGHGVGLELDEWPVITDRAEVILREGMTLAVEPKVVVPGEGVIGLENTFVVGPRSMKPLNAFPNVITVL